MTCTRYWSKPLQTNSNHLLKPLTWQGNLEQFEFQDVRRYRFFFQVRQSLRLSSGFSVARELLLRCEFGPVKSFNILVSMLIDHAPSDDEDDIRGMVKVGNVGDNVQSAWIKILSLSMPLRRATMVSCDLNAEWPNFGAKYYKLLGVNQRAKLFSSCCECNFQVKIRLDSAEIGTFRVLCCITIGLEVIEGPY